KIGNFTWTSGMAVNNYSFGNQSVGGLSKNGFSNLLLTWEKTAQTDFGIVGSILNDRLSFEIDYYNKKTNNMLFAKNIPSILGYATSRQSNIDGAIQNQGLEISLRSTNYTDGVFQWNTDFNISFNKSKVLSLGDREFLDPRSGTPGWSNVYRIKVGDPLG